MHSVFDHKNHLTWARVHTLCLSNDSGIESVLPASVCGSPDERFRHSCSCSATDSLHRVMAVLVGEDISVHLMRIRQELISLVDHPRMSVREISTAKPRKSIRISVSIRTVYIIPRTASIGSLSH